MKTLRLINVSKTFYTEIGDLKVLDNINLEVEKGEIVAIVGPSGSGKSTLLNIISKLIKPSNGEVQISGNIGYMFQKDHLFNWRTVWKNVTLGLEIAKNKNNEEYVRKLLEKYELIEFKDNFPNELSGGMRQRIALIRTLATKPNILLLDEPFSALDYQTRIKVSEDIYKIIKDQGVSAILVTHDISEAISMADKVVVFSRRPARLKETININLDGSLSPIDRRKSPKFSEYYDRIWGLLNEK